MSIEDGEALNKVQKQYERDPTNPERAYEYFQALNQHQFYMSVVREYENFKDNDENSSSSNVTKDQWNQLNSQYDYALDHLKQVIRNQEPLEN